MAFLGCPPSSFQDKLKRLQCIFYYSSYGYGSVMIRETDFSKRIFGLDVFRTAAIMFVLVAHSSIFLIPLPSSLKRIIPHFGFLGVELFFVLSGFLIGTIIIKIYNFEKFSFYTVRQFWIRRWFRTLPNYYLILTVNFLIGIYLWKSNINWDWTYLIFVQNFIHRHPVFFVEAWSLSIEEWFYIIFPVSIIIINFLVGRFTDKKSILISTILFFIFAGLLLRISFTFIFNPPWDAGIRKVVLLRLDSIMFGVLAAFINFYHHEFCNNYRRTLLFLGLSMTLLAIGYLSLISYSAGYVLTSAEDFFTKTFLFSLIDFGCACILPYAAGVKIERHNAATRIVTHTSIISYSAYLIHHSIILKMQKHLYNEFFSSDSYAWILNYVLFWILIFTCSTFLYKVYEKPFMGLRDRFWSKSRPIAVTASSESMAGGPDA
jgi:peptidoglycan/LPS O-acetylase OafA/YrhL